jgi:NDP-sugar pyrophosphorylase family protein
MYTILDLFSLHHSLAGDWLSRFCFPHEALQGISQMIVDLGKRLNPEEYVKSQPDVWVHQTARVFASAYLAGPCIIGPGTEVRHCAHIRGAALVGAHCVVGTATELKNVILFDGVQVPHYNYVGDSILGHKAHMGAGSITSNLKSDHQPVVLRHGDERLDTGLPKVGAFIGDEAEIGCNAVLNPGSVVGRKAVVYPTSCVRGTVPEGHILKVDGSLVPRR